MGNKLFGIDVSGLIKKHVGPGVLAATLVKITPGVRTTQTGGTNPTSTNFSCRGFIDSQRVRFRSGALVRNGHKVVVLIGDTIGAVPALGDQIIIEGTSYTIPDDGTIDRDPAAATYTCEVRPT